MVDGSRENSVAVLGSTAAAVAVAAAVAMAVAMVVAVLGGCA